MSCIFFALTSGELVFFIPSDQPILTMATMIRFANSGATWESLTAVDGDTMLVDEYFVRYTQSGMTPVASDTQLERFEGADEDAEWVAAPFPIPIFR